MNYSIDERKKRHSNFNAVLLLAVLLTLFKNIIDGKAFVIGNPQSTHEKKLHFLSQRQSNV
jgi:hypothetical protein